MNIYKAEPRSPQLVPQSKDVITVDTELQDDSKKGFFSTLNSNILQQLELLCLRFLIKRNKVSFEQQISGSKFESNNVKINHEDPFKECHGYIEDYINRTGNAPKYLFIGSSLHQELVEFLIKRDIILTPFIKDAGGKKIKMLVEQQMQVKVIFTSWMEGIFLWGGEEN